LYLIFVASPGAFIAAVLGLIFDKKKLLALLMTLLSGAWVAFLCMQIFNLC
jgi:hypothetical protein